MDTRQTSSTNAIERLVSKGADGDSDSERPLRRRSSLANAAYPAAPKCSHSAERPVKNVTPALSVEPTLLS